jgi:hypothetical protein
MHEQMTIFEQGWPGEDTICGWGSTMEHTKMVRTMLPRILAMAKAKTVNDAGCGDLFWIKTLDLSGIDYLGYDLYERSTWPALREEGWNLQTADITTDDLRPSDLIICRDVFIHLPNHMILDALDRFKRSAKYLFTTNFLSPKDDAPQEDKIYQFTNFDRAAKTQMKHSKLDLRLSPFNLGNPMIMIAESYPYKNMSLWRLN